MVNDYWGDGWWGAGWWGAGWWGVGGTAVPASGGVKGAGKKRKDVFDQTIIQLLVQWLSID